MSTGNETKEASAQLEFGDERCDVTVKALGKGFVFVRTDATPLSVGAAIELRFHSPDASKMYRVSGTIVLVADAPSQDSQRRVTGYTVHVTQGPALVEERTGSAPADAAQAAAAPMTPQPTGFPPPFAMPGVHPQPMAAAPMPTQGPGHMLNPAMIPHAHLPPGVGYGTPMPQRLPTSGMPQMFAPPNYPPVPTPHASMPIPAMPQVAQPNLPSAAEDPGE